MTDVVVYDKNIVYRVTFLAPIVVTEEFYNDEEDEYPPGNRTVEGEIHIFHDVVIVIGVDEHVIDSLDQPVDMVIIPAVCVQDIVPLYRRKDKK